MSRDKEKQVDAILKAFIKRVGVDKALPIILDKKLVDDLINVGSILSKTS